MKASRLVDAGMAQLDRAAAWLSRQHRAVEVVAVGLGLWIVSAVMFSASWWIPFDEVNRLFTVMKQAEAPLRTDLAEPIMRYRLVVPVFAYLTLIRGWGLLALQFAVNAALIGTTYSVFRGLLKTRQAGLVAAALVAFSEPGIVGNVWIGLFDGVSHLCTLLALATRRLLLVLLLVVVGLINDERMLVTLPFIAAWQLWVHRENPKVRDFAAVALSLAAGVGAWTLFRLALRHGVIGPGVEEPQVYSEIGADFADGIPDGLLRKPLTHLFALLFSFRFAWLFVAGAFKTPQRRLMALLLAGFLLEAYVLFFGGDITRGMAFAYPLILMGFVFCYRMNPVATLRRGVVVAVLLALLPHLNFDKSPGRTGWVRPLPLALLRAKTGFDFGASIKALFKPG